MLIHPMVERLRGLGLAAMADAFMEMQRNSTVLHCNCCRQRPTSTPTGSAAG